MHRLAIRLIDTRFSALLVFKLLIVNNVLKIYPERYKFEDIEDKGKNPNTCLGNQIHHGKSEHSANIHLPISYLTTPSTIADLLKRNEANHNRT